MIEEQVTWNESAILRVKLEQREKFIDEILAALENSNSKSAIVVSLLNRCREQINAQKLGVL